MGQYIGKPVFEFLEDGRLLKLANEFSYQDDAQLIWRAPKDAIVDGASIPRPLWTITGGPLEGKYRNASVLHDWYCDERSRGWRDVHRMFHEAMLVSGVSSLQARIMYLAVYYGGPRWSDKTVANNNLDPSVSDGSGATFRSYRSVRSGEAAKSNARLSDEDEAEKPEAFVKDVDVAEFEKLALLVEHGDGDPDSIDSIVDQQTTHLIR